MKKLPIILCFFVSASCLCAQNVEIKKKEKLLLAEKGYYPQLNEAGTQVLYSSESYKGLKLYDIATKAKVELTNEQGAGYKPVFAENNNAVYYKVSSYQRGRKYDALMKSDLVGLKREQITAPSREMKSPQAVKSGVVVVSERSMLRSGEETASASPYVCIENNKIVLYRNNQRQELQPCGTDVIGYVWPSISPDGSKILFVCAGKGAFTSDLEGNLISSLGAMEAPVWYSDDYVVGMIAEDDGHNITSSKIAIVSADGKYRKDLIDKKELGMYPAAASDKIVYNTLDGDMYMLTLEVEN